MGPHALQQYCCFIMNNDAAQSAVLTPTLRKAPSIWQVRSRHSFQFKFNSHQQWVNCNVVTGFQDKYTVQWITSEKQLHLVLSYRLAKFMANIDIYQNYNDDKTNHKKMNNLTLKRNPSFQRYKHIINYQCIRTCYGAKGHKRTFHISQLCDPASK